MNQMRELLRQTKDDEALIADLVAIEAGTYVEVASPHVPQSLEWREEVNEAGGEYDRSYACHTLRGPDVKQSVLARFYLLNGCVPNRHP